MITAYREFPQHTIVRNSSFFQRVNVKPNDQNKATINEPNAPISNSWPIISDSWPLNLVINNITPTVTNQNNMQLVIWTPPPTPLFLTQVFPTPQIPIPPSIEEFTTSEKKRGRPKGSKPKHFEEPIHNYGLRSKGALQIVDKHQQ